MGQVRPPPPPEPPAQTPTDSALLRRILAESAASGRPREALRLRLSLLPSAWARPHHLRLARAALDPLLLADRARLFRLPGQDLVVVWRGEAAEAEAACRHAVAHLFGGDPADTALLDAGTLIDRLELPRDAPRLERAIEEAERAVFTMPAEAVPPRAPLDTVALATLEAHLARADVARFARRRDVCAIDQAGRFTLRWEQRFLSIEELGETLAPDIALQADPWLFRRLTRTLDHRMLASLSHPAELRGAGPFALHLNVASILAPEFLRFDAALPASLRGRIVLDLLPADMLADPAAFLFAREFSRARGYRLLLRASHPALLSLLPLASTGLDLIRLRWSPTWTQAGALACDPGRIVLGRADTVEAIAWGRARGIGLFQGRLVRRDAAASVAAPGDPESSGEAPRGRAMSRKLALGAEVARA